MEERIMQAPLLQAQELSPLVSAAPTTRSGALWSTVHAMKNQRVTKCFRNSVQSSTIDEALKHNKNQGSHEGEDDQQSNGSQSNASTKP